MLRACDKREKNKDKGEKSHISQRIQRDSSGISLG